MALDLVPNNFFSFPQFPSFNLPSIWEDDDDWLTPASSPSGLSISEDDANVYVEAAVPGIDPKNIEVTYQDGYVWIKGQQNEEEKDKSRKYYRQATSSFSYRIAIPGNIQESADPKATYKNGIMTVAFQKSEKAQPKRIPVVTS